MTKPATPSTIVRRYVVTVNVRGEYQTRGNTPPFTVAPFDVDTVVHLFAYDAVDAERQAPITLRQRFRLYRGRPASANVVTVTHVAPWLRSKHGTFNEHESDAEDPPENDS